MLNSEQIELDNLNEPMDIVGKSMEELCLYVPEVVSYMSERGFDSDTINKCFSTHIRREVNVCNDN